MMSKSDISRSYISRIEKRAPKNFVSGLSEDEVSPFEI